MEPPRTPDGTAALALAAHLLLELMAKDALTLPEAQKLVDRASVTAQELGGDRAEVALLELMASLNQMRGVPRASGHEEPPA